MCDIYSNSFLLRVLSSFFVFLPKFSFVPSISAASIEVSQLVPIVHIGLPQVTELPQMEHIHLFFACT